MRPKTKKSLSGLVVFLAIVTAIGGFVLRAVEKVRTGHGLDYYFTGEGVQMNYLGALLAICVAAAAAIMGGGVRYWSRNKHGWSVKKAKIKKRKEEKI